MRPPVLRCVVRACAPAFVMTGRDGKSHHLHLDRQLEWLVAIKDQLNKRTTTTGLERPIHIFNLSPVLIVYCCGLERSCPQFLFGGVFRSLWLRLSCVSRPIVHIFCENLNTIYLGVKRYCACPWDNMFPWVPMSSHMGTHGFP